jgi:hypothetical protein
VDVRTEAAVAEGSVRFEEWFEAPRRLTGSVTNDPSLPYDVDVELKLEGDRYAPVSLRLKARAGGPVVTGEHLRDVSVTDILRRVVEDYFFGSPPSPRPSSVTITPPTASASAGAFTPHLISLLGEPPEVGRISDDVLKDVADAYRVGVLVGYPPVAVVAERYKRPRATAARWITTARDRGFLEAVSSEDDQ